jgi:excisionase family DNA binding protein
MGVHATHQDLQTDVLLTADDVAGMLKVRPSWVYSAAKRGELPCIRVGRWVRFDRRKVHEWIDAGGVAVEEPIGMRP